MPLEWRALRVRIYALRTEVSYLLWVGRFFLIGPLLVGAGLDGIPKRHRFPDRHPGFLH
jgi:hypothetical protein